MKKIFLIVSLFGFGFLYGCGTFVTPPTQTTIPTSVDCKGDMSCLQKNLLACTSATFTMPFMTDTNLVIEVVGSIDHVCDYKTMVVNSKDGSPVGPRGTECKLPMELMNSDRVGHLFGAEKVPGREAIALAQQELDAQYCTQF